MAVSRGMTGKPAGAEGVGRRGVSAVCRSFLGLSGRFTAMALVALLVAMTGASGGVGASGKAQMSGVSGRALPCRVDNADARMAAPDQARSLRVWRSSPIPAGGPGPASLLPPGGSAAILSLADVRRPFRPAPDARLVVIGRPIRLVPTGPPAI